MKKNLLSIIFFTGSITIASAQTTVVFKPGATTGVDAVIRMADDDCILTGASVTPAEINYGDIQELHTFDWTFSSEGCGAGTSRCLLRFTQLSEIPSDATITDAKLKLFGMSSSPTGSASNSSYPGSPLSENPCWLERVVDAWEENDVTWNTQPGTTEDGKIEMPKSETQWNWDETLDVTDMVQEMISTSENYGFMIKLQTEEYYRNLTFASSDHEDPKLWPELEVTYTNRETKIDNSGQVYHDMKIYPNPATENWNVEFRSDKNELLKVSVYSVDGRLLLEKETKITSGLNHILIPSENLSTGIYLAVFSNGESKEYRRIIRG